MKQYIRERKERERNSVITGVVMTVVVHLCALCLISFSGIKYLDPPPPESTFLLDFEEDIELIEQKPGREPRGEEENGLDYHFLTKERFEELLKEDAFMEHALVHGNYYGTLKAPIVEVLNEGHSMILDIDVQGAAKVREYVRSLPNTDPLKIGYVDIFILPPSMEDLRSRLVGRGTDSPAAIEKRLANAESEIARQHEYMYQVTNDDLGVCYKRLCDLIDALSGRM